MQIDQTESAVSIFFSADINADYQLCDDLILFCASLGIYTNISDEQYNYKLELGKTLYIQLSWPEIQLVQSKTKLMDFIQKLEQSSLKSSTKRIVRLAIRDIETFNDDLTAIYKISHGEFSITPMGLHRVNEMFEPKKLFIYEIEFHSTDTLLAYKLSIE